MKLTEIKLAEYVYCKMAELEFNYRIDPTKGAEQLGSYALQEQVIAFGEYQTLNKISIEFDL